MKGGFAMTADEIKKAEKQVATGRGESTKGLPTFIPQVDIYEDAKVITLQADMPGVGKEGVHINIKDDQLTINGRVSLPAEGETLLHKEYEVGNYFRQFTLSEIIDQGKITAKMADGVLTLILPKAEKAVPKKIEISVG